METTPNSLALAKDVYAAYAEADLVPLFEVLDEKVVWRSHTHPESPLFGEFDGIEAVQRYFAGLSKVDTQRLELKDLVSAGDRVVALLNVRRVVLDTGQVSDGTCVHVWRLKGDRVVEVDLYEPSASAG